MRRIAIALLLIAGFYTDAQLYHAKRAHAEEGSGRILVKPICVSATAGCDFWEIGWLDQKGQFHPVERLHADDLRERLHAMIRAGAIKPPPSGQ